MAFGRLGELPGADGLVVASRLNIAHQHRATHQDCVSELSDWAGSRLFIARTPASLAN